MINSFNNYLKLGKVKRKTPDFEEAKALLEKSNNRLEYTEAKEINEKNSQFVLEDAYEAIRESAQALMSVKGFKPYSHEATISFIKEYYNSVFNEEELYKFDRFRQLRNDSVYKAIPILNEDAKASLLFAVDFLGKVKSLVNKQETNPLRETFRTLKVKKSVKGMLNKSDKEDCNE